ncbi:hypothetical protein G7Z17_g5765 [Cylindrodendrum hubeiense]|uniref:Uncharacterized protein n=1 Tax=Cylindrodendrum hubeiense TaxID=595255 RepID=A0A9P5HEC2_9HYPO|nr:hypothetical protein G7Z17_g5765 [Cylindrodendrum hubeiense]
MSHVSRLSSSSKKHGPGRGKGGSYEEQLTQVSFLFMVNELRYHMPERDCYHNFVPPTDPASYTNEIPSRIMHYSNGNVSEAPGFHWERQTNYPAEGILYGQNLEATEWYPVEKYKTYAVFACNSHLPIMITPHDPLHVDTNSCWQLLQLFHPRGLRGISQVAGEDSEMGEGPGLVRHAAGARPSWIPSLLPSTYKSTMDNPPTSRGLGGELPVILGLMALSAEPDPTETNMNTNHVFLGHQRRWRRQQWTHSERPSGYPQTDQDDPRGFLVNVFYDPSSPQTSNDDILRYFQWTDAIVREPRS